MRIFLSFFALAGLIFSTAAHAEDVCDVALTSRAFNTTQANVSENIAYAKRDDVCNSTYSSLQEAQNAAKSAGFNLSYAGIGIGANGDKASSDTRVDIRSTDFCRATAEDFKRAFSSNYNQQVADAALIAWSDCVEKNSSRLSVSYTMSSDGQYFAGTIVRTAATGSLLSTISGISVVGAPNASVLCNIGGQDVRPGKLNVPITTTRTAFGCRKSKDAGVMITVQTSGDSLPPIHMPSKLQLNAARFDEMDARLNSLLPTNFYRAVVGFEGRCPAGWSDYDQMAGRVMVGINQPRPDGTTANDLPRYDLGIDYGKPDVVLEVANLPPHTHDYKDIYYSEAWGTYGSSMAGSASTDYDNKGYEVSRTTAPTGSAKPVPIQIPVRALRFCQRNG